VHWHQQKLNFFLHQLHVNTLVQLQTCVFNSRCQNVWSVVRYSVARVTRVRFNRPENAVLYTSLSRDAVLDFNWLIFGDHCVRCSGSPQILNRAFVVCERRGHVARLSSASECRGYVASTVIFFPCESH
jgi:hypothetical protein